MSSPSQVRTHCQGRIDGDGQALLRLAMGQLALSARAFHRILKLARTIADLASRESITAAYLGEELQYRRRPA